MGVRVKSSASLGKRLEMTVGRGVEEMVRSNRVERDWQMVLLSDWRAEKEREPTGRVSRRPKGSLMEVRESVEGGLTDKYSNSGK